MHECLIDRGAGRVHPVWGRRAIKLAGVRVGCWRGGGRILSCCLGQLPLKGGVDSKRKKEIIRKIYVIIVTNMYKIIENDSIFAKSTRNY